MSDPLTAGSTARLMRERSRPKTDPPTTAHMRSLRPGLQRQDRVQLQHRSPDLSDRDQIPQCWISALLERFGLSWIRRLWTCRGAAIGIAMQRMAPRMAPKHQTVHPSSRGEGLFRTGLGGTPGGTRIPNLLIRRWTQTVHSRPQRSIPSATNRFAVRSRP